MYSGSISGVSLRAVENDIGVDLLVVSTVDFVKTHQVLELNYYINSNKKKT